MRRVWLETSFAVANRVVNRGWHTFALAKGYSARNAIPRVVDLPSVASSTTTFPLFSFLSLPLPSPPPSPPLLCTPPSVFPHRSSPLFLFYSRFLPFSFPTPGSPPFESFVSFSTYYFAPVHCLCLGLHTINPSFHWLFFRIFLFAIMQSLEFY